MSLYSPLVTIAIPTFNRARWLRGCVQAALAQSYGHLEVVVSNNASTDETSDVLAEFNDQRLRVLTQPQNVGLFGNWNACLDEAAGEYIVFVPDDDRIAPWFLERCVALLRRDPNLPVVVALSGIDHVESAKMEPAPANPRLPTGVWDGADILREYFCGRIYAFHACTTLISTAMLRNKGGYSTGWPYAGDLEAWFPSLLSGNAGFVNESCGHVSFHGATTTSGFDVEIRLNDLRGIVNLMKGSPGEPTRDREKRRQVEKHARRWLAISAISLVASRRKEGASLIDVLPMMWRWRRELSHLDMFDGFKGLRALALIVLPSPITNYVRQIKPSLQAGARRLQ